jgi:hypothetical protein
MVRNFPGTDDRYDGMRHRTGRGAAGLKWTPANAFDVDAVISFALSDLREHVTTSPRHSHLTKGEYEPRYIIVIQVRFIGKTNI